MKKLIITGLLIIASVYFAPAQQVSCTEQLRQAERRYDEGLLEVIPGMINSCLASGFTREEKINAYRLLVQTYLFSDNIQAADEKMYSFLREFPEYEITPTDPKEFINLYNTYRTEPIMRIEPYFGLNYSMPYIVEYYGVGDLNNTTPRYSSGFGFGAGANYTNKINNKIDGSIGLSFQYSSVEYFFQVFEHTFIEGNYTDLYLGLPLSGRYNVRYGNLDFFARAGIETLYLLRSSNSLVRGFNAGGDNIVETVDLTDYRKKFDIRPFVGIGISPNIGNVRLLLDGGFRFGTIIPVNKDLRYSNHDLFEKFYFIEDKWIFNHFYLNITYVFSIYKPAKIE